jgi:Spy/CpxP family protein refolding chaperone
MRSGWRWVVGLVGLVTISLAAISAAAQGMPMRGGWAGPGGGPGGGPEAGAEVFPLRIIMRSVGLTDAQRDQVRQILTAHRPRFQALRGQIRALTTQLTDKLYAPGAVSADDASAIRHQISELRDQLGQEGLQTALEIRNVLTPEQLAKAAQIRNRMQELRAEMQNLMGGNP